MDGITDAMDMNFSRLQELVINREAWCSVVHEVAESMTRLSDRNSFRFTCLNDHLHQTERPCSRCGFCMVLFLAYVQCISFIYFFPLKYGKAVSPSKESSGLAHLFFFSNHIIFNITSWPWEKCFSDFSDYNVILKMI